MDGPQGTESLNAVSSRVGQREGYPYPARPLILMGLIQVLLAAWVYHP